MLVLSRKLQESIKIGDNVVVMVLAIRGNKVQLGIDAPKEIHVLRAELPSAMPEFPTGFVTASVAATKS